MTRKLLQTKRDYDDFISTYMYNHHMSFKTLEATKTSWRTEREYDADIAKQLIRESKTFMRAWVLSKGLDLNFRKRIVNYIARYLSVYMAKATEYAGYESQTEKEDAVCSALKETLMQWSNAVEEATKKCKASKRHGKRKRIPAPKATDTTRTKCEIKSDGTVVQRVTVGPVNKAETHTFTYPDIAAYKRQHDLDCARVMSAHHR